MMLLLIFLALDETALISGKTQNCFMGLDFFLHRIDFR